MSTETTTKGESPARKTTQFHFIIYWVGLENMEIKEIPSSSQENTNFEESD